MDERDESLCPPTDLEDERHRVVIVGAGAAGTLSTIALLRQLESLAAAVEVVLVDPGEPAAGGVAFSTTDPAHLLNVRTRDLSVHLDDVGHFTAWVGSDPGPDAAVVDPDGFRPRGTWGDYLRATLAETTATAGATGRVSVVPVRGTAVSMQSLASPGDLPPTEARRADRVVVGLDTGERVVADAVVLALGIEAPGIDWAPAELLASDRFVVDPWRPGELARLARAGGDVLLVGTGLTMVDVALSLARPGRTVHATSRRGLLPAVHATTRLAGVPCGPLVAAIGAQTIVGLPTVRRLVADHLAAGARRGDWRPAFDGLRPVTALLWQRLSLDDRREFLRTDAARWDTHRHRMPARTAAALAARRRSGEVVVGRGEVVSVATSETGLRVLLGDGRELDVAHVVNCTGPQRDVARSSNPLVVDLLASGAGQPGPLGIGLSTDLAGRLQGGTDAVRPHHWPAWCVGALRRGDLWESGAVPEMRAQAASAAAHVTARLRAVTAEGAARATGARRGGPSPRRGIGSPRPTDGHGLALSTTAEAAAAYNLGLMRVLCVQDGADAAFREAVALDPAFSLGHAALALLGHELGSDDDVPASIAAARGTLSRWATDREHSFVDVVARRVAGSPADGAAALMAHLSAHPRDALAVSAAVPTIAFSGVTDLQQESWALVESLRPAYGDDWWYAGLLAFVRQDQGRYDDADRLAARALREVPGSGHAVHAQTHVFYETGQHAAGLRWLDGWISTSGRQASHLAHFSWHAALHELSLGSVEALHRRYDAELAPPHVSGVRALVDSASLLWRCQVTGSWAGDLPLSSVLDTIGPELLERPTTPFTAMHAAVALAAAGDLPALARLRAHAAARPEPVMRDVVVQLCDALAAVVEQRWDDAVRTLRLLGPWLVQLGGSAAQREIVEDTLLFALVRCGRCGEARALLEARLDRRPSPLDRRRLDAVPA